MIGFYFHYEYNKDSTLNYHIISYQSFVDIPKVEKNILYVFESEHSVLLQKQDYLIYNIGTLIYNNEFNKKAIELIYKDLGKKNIKEIVNKFRGEFCLLIKDDKNNIYIITDKLGIFPVYKVEDKKSVQISNIFTILCKFNNLTINYQALSEFMSLREDGYCIGSTFFNEITQLDMSCIYQYNKEHSIFRYYDIFDDLNLNTFNKFNEICEETRNILSNNLRFLTNQEKIFVDLTGGHDTRLNATIFKDLGVDYTIGICGEQNIGESRLAEIVANELKMKIIDNYRIKNENQFEDILEEHFNLINGVPYLYHTTELVNYYKEIARDFNIHVGGFGGTELFIQYCKPLDIVSNKFNVNNFLNKYYRYSDLFKDKYISGSDYYDELNKKINYYFEKIGSDKFEDVATPLNFFIYSRYYHGSIIGTHNCLFPYYTPYFESDFVKFMIETKYSVKKYHNIQSKIISEMNRPISLIMTTNGYSANFGEFNIRDTISKQSIFLRDLGRRVIFHSNLVAETFENMRSIFNKGKTQDTLEDSDRKYWNNYIHNHYTDKLEIFELIDKNKFDQVLLNHTNKNKYLAKIIYLDKLIRKYNPKF